MKGLEVGMETFCNTLGSLVPCAVEGRTVVSNKIDLKIIFVNRLFCVCQKPGKTYVECIGLYQAMFLRNKLSIK